MSGKDQAQNQSVISLRSEASDLADRLVGMTESLAALVDRVHGVSKPPTQPPQPNGVSNKVKQPLSSVAESIKRAHIWADNVMIEVNRLSEGL